MTDMHKGKLSIHRQRSNVGDGCVSIEVTDQVSGCMAFYAEASLLEFAEALMAHGHRECEFRVFTKYLGMKREVRSIVIPRPERGGHLQDEAAEDAGLKWIIKHAKKELVDGWEPHQPSEVFNGHRWVGTKQVRVGLIRFVAPSEAEEAEEAAS